jgi:pimeloyl-ACP methyl ester carboxylesterase
MEGDAAKKGMDCTVVFIHGAGGSARTWYFQQEYFKNLLDVVLVDLPGHGGSPGEGSATIEGYCDFVARGLRTRGSGPVSFVGHSMGGAIALSMALAHPEMVKSLVLMGTGARLRVLPEILEGITGDMKGTAGMILDIAFAEGTPPMIKEVAREEYLKNRPEVLLMDFTACDGFDVTASLDRIGVPTLVLCGTLDRLTPVRYSQFLKAGIPGASLCLVEDAGHMVMLEKPAETNTALEEFFATLNENEARRPPAEKEG